MALNSRNYRTNDLGIFGFLVAVGLILLAVGGWIANIVKLYGLATMADPNLVMAVLRGCGVFLAPLGVILGFL